MGTLTFLTSFHMPKIQLLFMILALTNNEFVFVSVLCSKANRLPKLCIGADDVRNNRSFNLSSRE